eukprot:TRINITY_DN14553_c0_g2_i1.p1 TRINITY_DN14553_c0_g2~~TRINITY_DN14553_c0_g2_i1.p1  ORF type:complete len:789 (-),score=164.35 TRINITY_DN14553_c0_g2_i1:152-2518(-)
MTAETVSAESASIAPETVANTSVGCDVAHAGTPPAIVPPATHEAATERSVAQDAPLEPADGGVLLQVCDAGKFAIIRLTAVWAEPVLRCALAECYQRAASVSAVFLCATSACSAGEKTSACHPNVEGTVPVDLCRENAGIVGDASGGGLCALADMLERLPQLFIGFIERDASYIETCLFAACDLVHAAADVQLSIAATLSGIDGGSAAAVVGAAAVPVSLLKLLGPQRLERALSDSVVGSNGVAGWPQVLPVRTALEVGLVSSLASCGGTNGQESLRGVLQDLAAAFVRNPVEALTTQRWTARRSARGTAWPVTDRRSVGASATSWSAASLGRPSRAEVASITPRPAKRPRLALPSPLASWSDKCVAVCREVSGGEDLPEPAGGLLAALVSASLAVPPEERTESEREALEAIGRALADVVQRQNESMEAMVVMFDSADVERSARDAALARAQSMVLELRSVTTDRKRELDTLSKSLRASMISFAETESKERAANEDLDNAAVRKQKLEAALAEVFSQLREGTVTGTKARKQAAALVALGVEYGFDDTLVVGIPGAAVTKLEKRTEFDNMFLDAFEAEMKDSIAQAERVILEGEPEREVRRLAVQEARLEHARVLLQQEQAKEAISKAQDDEKDASVGVHVAEQAVLSFESELRRLDSLVKHAKNSLEELRSGTLAFFVQARDRGAPRSVDAASASAAVSSATAVAEVPVEGQPPGSAALAEPSMVEEMATQCCSVAANGCGMDRATGRHEEVAHAPAPAPVELPPVVASAQATSETCDTDTVMDDSIE